MSAFLFFLATARDGFIVACQGGKVVGYVIANSRRGEGLIQSIAVSPGSRRRGAGRMLVRAAVGHLAARFRRVYLQVDAKHEGTIRFYRALSFTETGRVLRRYYPNGDDAVEMVRGLSPL
jgi:[ribosomal protein S18]-alanine N-acetyltransferase